MKWYSVKKYKPPLASYRLLIALANGSYLLGDFENPSSWYDEEGDPIPDETVTHFAVIDPVEIEGC